MRLVEIPDEYIKDQADEYREKLIRIGISDVDDAISWRNSLLVSEEISVDEINAAIKNGNA